MENKKPKHLLVLKIIGFIGLFVGIAGFIFVFIGFSNFEITKFMIGGFLGTFGIFIGVSCLTIGFRPEISKMSTKSTRYIQKENQEDLTDIANTSADISKGAITKTARAIKEGFADDKMYCKHCGELIDADSKFCNKCGKEQ